ncbi:hypothetical protein ABFS82_05G142000 [Erythranthe guttata]|uniref:SKP1-like protein n=1 Tax=Erythranthe guttata TaxID=4155 RepID=A0A022QXM2_ERYGU|nr:PREDICTED: SKP1-like protein 1A [Erythranthe guttata]EYU32354.1 hypothetical protein MIMGU_mgv1a020137mg [Erythranthe guttata]|eukprot:XP_012843476.1 PREDICTED: SKP1-like protein 1A [Erythranthe guttata]
MVVLMSNDGVIFTVEESAAARSQTINQMIEDGCSDGNIPLPNVDSKTLEMVIEYCTRHDKAERMAEGAEAKAAAEEYDAELMKVDVKTTLFNLMMAANYLNIDSLLKLTALAAGNAVKGKEPEEIRDTFGIINDLTPEEEDQIRKDNTWSYE